MHRKCKPHSLGQNVKILAARSCSTRMLTIHGGASRSEFTCHFIVDWWFIQCIPERNMGKAILGVSFILKHVHVFASHLYQHQVCPGVSSIAFNMPHRGLEQNRQMNQRQLFVRRVAPGRALQFLKNGTKNLCCRTDNGEICETIIFMRRTSVQHAVDACVVCIHLHGGPGLTVNAVISS